MMGITREVSNMSNEVEIRDVVPRCGKCGSDDLRMPEGVTSQDDLADDSLLTCAHCNTTITYTALVEACEADLADNIQNGLRGARDLLD
jgi:hypothetical protein